jgi:hypothetical protein
MPDIFYLFSKWWKQIFSVVALTLVTTGIILYLKPSRYLSIATALPASSYAADKASVFEHNIQTLYSPLGTTDDLDVIVGTAQLDTPYISMAEKFDLASHYKVKEQGEAATLKAAYLLKKNTRVIKSEYSELKVKVWDEDRAFAPQLANAVLEKLQDIHRDLQNSNNIASLKNLQSGKEKVQAQVDSINGLLKNADISPAAAEMYATRRTALSVQLQQYEKLISEYQLMVESKPPVLIVVEKARVSNWPDQPKRIPVLVASFVLSLVFSLMVILVMEKRKTVKQ